MTNYEKIKNMSVEEMAEFILKAEKIDLRYAEGCVVCEKYEQCHICIEQWLNKEVSE